MLDAPDTTWHHTMSADELLEVLTLLDVDTPPEATHEDLVSMLEAVTGCGCFGATCGTGACDHACGTCMTDSQSCFSGTCQTEMECTDTVLNPSQQEALSRSKNGTFQFRYEALVDGEFDIVRIQSNTSVTEAMEPGVYDLRQFDISACALCVRAYKDCNDGACLETWVATSGTVEIETDLLGEQVIGKVSELRFQQSYEDPKTANVYVLPQQTELPTCLTAFEFQAAIETIVLTPSACDPAGNGVSIGSNIGDLTLLNCYGDPVTLHQYCGSRAVWLMAAAGW